MADDNESPFANFVPSTEPLGAEPPKDNKKKSGGKKKAGDKKKPAAAAPEKLVIPAPTKVATPPKAPKKARKPRAAKVVSRTLKIDLGLALTAVAGLSDSDVAMLETVADIMSDAPKKSRHRIAHALSKIFA